MKPWCDEWLRTSAEPAEEKPQKTAPAPAEPEHKPLQELEKNRPAPPPNPTGQPDQKPMPLSELMRILETASKSILDAGLDLEKGAAWLMKVNAMGGATPQEREIVSKSDALAKKVSAVKQESDKLAMEIAEYRKGLSSGNQGNQGWTQ